MARAGGARRSGAVTPLRLRCQVTDQPAQDLELAEHYKVAFRVRGDLSKRGAAVGSLLGFFSFLIDGVGLFMVAADPGGRRLRLLVRARDRFTPLLELRSLRGARAGTLHLL